MRKKLLFVLVVILLIIAGFFGYKSLFSTASVSVGLTTIQVTKGDIENTVTATGTVSPKSYVDVGAQVSGQIMQIYVDVGDVVKKGDLLVEIDTTVLETKVESSKAELAYQKAQLKDREAKLTLAKSLYERQKYLLANNATSEESYENAESALLSAEASIDMIKAQIAQTESSLKENQANLKYAKIYAPMSGTISTLSVKKGQTLNSNLNTPSILQIADLSTVTIGADVSEADVTKLKRGMDVYFKTLGSSNVWRTKLSKIEPTPTVTNNVVLYKVLFDVENSSGELMNSMTTQVFFVLSSTKNATLVPVTAISRRDVNASRAMVMLKTENGTFAPTRVELGVSNRVQVEIKSGLKEGDTIASSFTPPAVGFQRPNGNNTQLPRGAANAARPQTFGIMR
ncbi:MAG: efflux RND transporter periplasmic adaptor subunit [Campylobacteraceae bacterium]|jgi:macrolide-specific efflux system membrane fusion protein|nr:efflux RND transporter periplasmic adaptor subunit [Campylobacteraceae bacterium]